MPPSHDPYASRRRRAVLVIQRAAYAARLLLRRLMHRAGAWLAWLSPTQLWVWRETALNRPWVRRGLAGLAMCVGGAIGAAVILHAVDPDPPVEARIPGTTVVRSAELALNVPTTWSKADAVPPIPLASARGLVLVDSDKTVRLVASVLAPDSPTLLPRALLDRLPEDPARPERVKLGGGLPAYFYSGLAPRGATGAQDYYVVPTSNGIATVVCFANGRGGGFLDACWRAANSLQLLHGSTVPLGEDSAFLVRRDAEIRAVDAARERARSQLTSATTPAAQAAAAREVSAAYASADGVLAPLAEHSPAFTAVVHQLRANAALYQRIATDLDRQDTVALRRDRESALEGEARLKQLLSE